MFNPEELNSIAGHLRIVANHYDENAATLRRIAGAEVASDTAESMAQQFERQAKEARAFADRIDASEEG